MKEEDFFTFNDDDIQFDDTMEEEIIDMVEDMLPGADVAVDFEPEDSRPSDWENDGDHSKFMEYLHSKITNIPKHNGKTTVGCERAIAYLRKLDKEISRAIQSDDKNVIDDEEAENLRDKIFDFIDTLENALAKISDTKKRKKTASLELSNNIYCRINSDGEPAYYAKAEYEGATEMLEMNMIEPSELQVQAYMEWESGKLTKEASSAKIVLTADPFLNEVTHIIIRSHVTYGRNIETIYRELAKKYSFSPRDHLAVQGLLREKGLLINSDLSRIDEEIQVGQQPVGVKSYPA